MEFKKYLKEVAGQLDKEVEKILKGELKRARETDKKLAPLLKAFIRSCKGGKRIRGALVVLGYRLGQNILDREYNGNDIMKVAVAYEILHAAVLVHDDIMDRSLLRRDEPSLYQVLGGNHRGVSQAINLADYGFFLSVKIISGANFPDKNKNQALELFSQVMMDTAWGQMLDLEKAHPQVVMKLKTAYYTISGPLQVGAVLAGAGPTSPTLRGIKKFGEGLGIAFQIQDDILDKEVDYLGGITNAKEEAEKHRNQAMKEIPQITKDPKLSIILEQMGEYLVQRTK